MLCYLEACLNQGSGVSFLAVHILNHKIYISAHCGNQDFRGDQAEYGQKRLGTTGADNPKKHLMLIGSTASFSRARFRIQHVLGL